MAEADGFSDSDDSNPDRLAAEGLAMLNARLDERVRSTGDELRRFQEVWRGEEETKKDRMEERRAEDRRRQMEERRAEDGRRQMEMELEFRRIALREQEVMNEKERLRLEAEKLLSHQHSPAGYGALQPSPSASPSASPSSRKVRLDKCDGSDWATYKIHFQMCMRANRWGPQEAVEELSAALRGEALKTLALFPADMLTLQNLTAEMDRVFGPSDKEQLYAMRMKGRIRQPDESIPQLGQSIKELAASAYPTMPVEYRDVIAKEAFVEAVNDTQLRQAIYRDRAETLSEAVNAAAEWECFQQVEKGRKQSKLVRATATPDATNTSATDTSKTNPMEEMMSSFGTLLQDLRDELVRSRQNQMRRGPRDMTKVRCHNCKEMGHMFRSCPKPLKPELSGNVNAPAKSP